MVWVSKPLKSGAACMSSPSTSRLKVFHVVAPSVEIEKEQVSPVSMARTKVRASMWKKSDPSSGTKQTTLLTPVRNPPCRRRALE